MEPLRITAVSYLNTFPFVYGILKSGLLNNFNLDLEVPSVCAAKFIDDLADIALVPAGSLPGLGTFNYTGDYCIGAISPVRTVLLLSNKPLHEIRKIHLDPDSRTSVQLVKVLSHHAWKINPEWVMVKPEETLIADGIESLVAIGDKTFQLSGNYKYSYDLAEEWIKFTSLPFVFAVWVSKKNVDRKILENFNRVLHYGVHHKPECIAYFHDRIPAGIDALEYLSENISFEFDEQKKKGLELFLSYLNGLKVSL
jgi:chorismate dehydratase